MGSKSSDIGRWTILKASLRDGVEILASDIGRWAILKASLWDGVEILVTLAETAPRRLRYDGTV
jgi:hypothetical protein